MKRNTKEEKRQPDEARKGLSEDEIMAIDLEDEIKQKVEALARTIHADKFPEENGMSVSGDTYDMCLEKAKLQIYSDLSLKRPPAKSCVFCNKTINAIGGKRIVAQELRGIGLSKKKTGGGNKDYPHQCVEIFSDPTIFLDFWGNKEKWTESAIMSAKNAYLDGKRPWFCQICGGRECSAGCGSPNNFPMGSDILYGNGCTSHAGIFPFEPGCSNPECKNYKCSQSSP